MTRACQQCNIPVTCHTLEHLITQRKLEEEHGKSFTIDERAATTNLHNLATLVLDIFKKYREKGSPEIAKMLRVSLVEHAHTENRPDAGGDEHNKEGIGNWHDCRS